jgi:hypothetical protein
MKQYLLLIFSFIIQNNLISQEVKNYEFIGTLQLSDKTIITFKLNFKEDADGSIKGTSLSDIYGADRTLSKIEGRISKDKKTISFKEIGNLNTKSQADVGTFCFIEANNAKLKKIKDKTIIQGAFVGKFKSGKKCADGYLYLMSSDYINKLADELLTSKNIKNKDTLATLKKKVDDLKTRTNNNIIKSNETLSLTWSSQEIIIDVWDGQTEDKDEISIDINGEKVLDKFIITNQKKTLIVPIKEQISTIKITAVSEGNTSPCTANVKLIDGNNETSLVAVLKKGESTTVKINK